MMDYEVLLASEAERCIDEQLVWYEADDANGGIELADRWMDQLEPVLESLVRHPERHGLAPENGRWMPEFSVRQMRFKPWTTPLVWRILFVIDHDAKRVTVLQIRHEKRPLLHDGGSGQ
ncbi:MAG: type II toxin-antitoxin system RelE/ParE family toxin [Luteolibacter sp.]